MTTTERGERITDEASEGGLPPDIELALAEYLEGISSGSPLLDCLWGELCGAINANLWAGNITAERAERLRKRYLFNYGDRDGTNRFQRL